jgi:hypothetical protein
MTEARRPGAISLVVLCYALCGPAIGTFIFVSYAAAVGWFGADPVPAPYSSASFFGLLLVFAFAIPAGYIFGALPAIATGLLSEGVNRISAHWGRNPFVCGFVGAAMSIPLVAIHTITAPLFRQPIDVQWLWPATGFIAAFCCNGIVQHFERRAEPPFSMDNVGRGSTS